MRVRKLAEPDLIAAIRKDFPARGREVVVGIGDDAAVVRAGRRPLILTTDLLVEGSHFLQAIQPAFYLGRKSLNVNISDIAAMGGRPRWALLGLGLPPATPKKWVEEFFAGLRRAAEDSGVELIGGDLSRSAKIMISVTLIGKARKFIRRNDGKPGHVLFISGWPGQSNAGLELLKKGFRLGRDRGADKLIKAFLDPIPQVELGLALARHGAASAMIDTSDGLSVDLNNLCRESGVGADVVVGAIPLSPELRRLRKSPLQDALYGGEDYGLLVCVPPAKLKAVERLRTKFQLTWIGRLTSGHKVQLIHPSGRRTLFPPRGFRHFL